MPVSLDYRSMKRIVHTLLSVGTQRSSQLGAEQELLKLPQEILLEILSFIHSLKDLCALRLVCCTFNAHLRARVVGCITLPPPSHDWKRWSALAGSTAAVRRSGVHTLRIRGVQEGKSRHRSRWVQTWNRDPGKAQDRWLGTSVKVLMESGAVKNLHWKITLPSSTTHDIFRTLGKTSECLKGLTLEMDDTENTLLAAHKWQPILNAFFVQPFSLRNLTFLSLDIHRGIQHPGMTECVTQIVRAILSSCSLEVLEELRLEGPYNLEVDIPGFGELMGDQPAKSALTRLHLTQIDLRFTPPVSHYLANLTSLALTAQWVDTNRLDAAWSSLLHSTPPIKLAVVKVATVSPGLLAYLQSYRGLREFHAILRENVLGIDSTFNMFLGQRSQPYYRLDNPLRDHLLERVLLLHEATLEAFVVRVDAVLESMGSDARRWCLSQRMIDAVRGYGALRRLEVVSLCHGDGRTMSMPWVMSIPQLLTLGIPSLREIHLHPVTIARTQLELGQKDFGLKDAIIQQLEQLARVEIPDVTSGGGTRCGVPVVTIYGRPCRLVYNEVRGTCRLDVSELLSEEQGAKGSRIQVSARRAKLVEGYGVPFYGVAL